MRTITFTMEDALISPEGFMILSGAGLVEPTATKTIKQHITETVDNNDEDIQEDEATGKFTIRVSKRPYLPDGKGDNFAYVMFVKDGVIVSEPYIPSHLSDEAYEATEEPAGFTENGAPYWEIELETSHEDYVTPETGDQYSADGVFTKSSLSFDSVIVDYYTEKSAGVQQIEITADKFGGNYYLEASTLFRDTRGVDLPAEFIIPNCKIQSNFTFSMAASGDPSSFTFTMDAFPDYTRFDHSKKVLCAIQIIDEADEMNLHRTATVHDPAHNRYFVD